MTFKEILQQHIFSKHILLLVGIFSSIELLMIYYISEDILSMMQLNVVLSILSRIFIILILQYSNHHSLRESLKTTLTTLRDTAPQAIIRLLLSIVKYYVYTYYDDFFFIEGSEHIFWIIVLIWKFLVLHRTYRKIRQLLWAWNDLQTNTWLWIDKKQWYTVIMFHVVFYIILWVINSYNNRMLAYDTDQYFLVLDRFILTVIHYIWLWIIINYVYYLVYQSDLTSSE